MEKKKFLKNETNKLKKKKDLETGEFGNGFVTPTRLRR